MKKKNTTVLLNTEHVRAMEKALHVTGNFDIEADYEDAGTVKAVWRKDGDVVYRAILKEGDIWLVTHRPDLFAAPEPQPRAVRFEDIWN